MPTPARIEKLQRIARQRQAGFTVIVEDVFDPHNLGAIARSCDAFGIQEINVIFETHAEFDPKAVGKNSSTATNKWLNYRIHQDTETALRTLKGEGWHIAATVLDSAAESIFEAELCLPKLALLFGNEKSGLSAQARAMADQQLTIPMRGIAQSMNVSVAAALFIYEATRQRRERCPQYFAAEPAAVARTFDYFLEMHQQLGKRNKSQRVERVKARQAKAKIPTVGR